ncbi:unnamed protein product [Discosporangium mesarthrocarpum]
MVGIPLLAVSHSSAAFVQQPFILKPPVLPHLVFCGGNLSPVRPRHPHTWDHLSRGLSIGHIDHTGTPRQVIPVLSAQGLGGGDKHLTPRENQQMLGNGVLGGVNLQLMRILITGEAIVGAAAAVLAFFAQINLFDNLDFSTTMLGLGVLGALPIFAASVWLERSGVDFFRKIDQDTKLYVLQIFGAKRNFPSVFLWSSILALSAGVFEEALFRGVIQKFLQGPLGAGPSLVVASLLFGFAHSPVPGANAFTEACYGANFGLLYILSGGNLVVPTVAHVVYDLLTFLEVHYRATGSIEVNMKGPVEQDTLGGRVGRVSKEFGLSPKFVNMAFSVFKQLDLDGNGSIDQQELKLGLRTFGKFTSDEEIRVIMCQADVDGNNVLSFDEFVRLLAINYSYLLKPSTSTTTEK